MVKNRFRSAREILARMEAVNARDWIKGQRATTFIAGRDYYLGIGHPPFRFEEASYTPVEVHGRTFTILDGPYTLIDDAYKALGLGDNPSEAQENMASDYVDHYLNAAFGEMAKGVNKGLIEGPMGPREWEFVYWPLRWQNGKKAEAPVLAVAGKPLPELPAAGP